MRRFIWWTQCYLFVRNSAQSSGKNQLEIWLILVVQILFEKKASCSFFASLFKESVHWWEIYSSGISGFSHGMPRLFYTDAIKWEFFDKELFRNEIVFRFRNGNGKRKDKICWFGSLYLSYFELLLNMFTFPISRASRGHYRNFRPITRG